MDEETAKEIRDIQADLDELKKKYGEKKGILVFLGHHPDELENLGGFNE
jgi:hypothetical protein